MKINMVIIDPQNDFTKETGSLYVDGASDDMARLSQLIDFLKDKINEIIVTLDAHQYNHIAHPCFWVDQNGKMPSPFTKITKDDFVHKKWLIANLYDGINVSRVYNHFNLIPELIIWPTHCVMGTEGFCINENVQQALKQWVFEKKKSIGYILKGENINMEQFSAVFQDDATEPNIEKEESEFMMRVNDGNPDLILVAGEALSHCVKATVENYIKLATEEMIKKTIIISDGCSSVKGFEKVGDEFLLFAESKGIKNLSAIEIINLCSKLN